MSYSASRERAHGIVLGQVVRIVQSGHHRLRYEFKHEGELVIPEGTLAVVTRTAKEIEWGTKVTIAIPVQSLVPSIYIQEDVEVDYLSTKVTDAELKRMFDFSCQILNERANTPEWLKYHKIDDNLDVIKAAHYRTLKRKATER